MSMWVDLIFKHLVWVQFGTESCVHLKIKQKSWPDSSILSRSTQDYCLQNNHLNHPIPAQFWSRHLWSSWARHFICRLVQTTGSTKDDPSQHDWKIVDWDIMNQNKQKSRPSPSPYYELLCAHPKSRPKWPNVLYHLSHFLVTRA